MRNTLLLVVLALSGCGNKGSEAKGDCTKAVTNAVNLGTEDFKKSGVTDPTQAKIRTESIARCNADKWSNEVLTCMVEAKKSDEVSKCQQMLSKEQNDNLAKVITNAMAAQPDSGSGSAPPPSSAGSAEGSASVTPGLPAECADYKAMIEKLAACDKVPPASRDMLKKSFDEQSKQWAEFDKLPADAKTALTGACKQSADALQKSAGPTCGF